MLSLDPHTVSIPVSPEDERTASRYAARRVLWNETNLKRIRSCGRAVIAGKAGVSVKVSTSDTGSRSVGYSGLASCGSTWACPCCSVKIAAERSNEISRAVDAWNARGGRVALVTLTMRHRRGQWLSELWDSVGKAWTAATDGRGWRADSAEFGVAMPREIKSGHRKGQVVVEKRIGFTRVVEVTHGKNGWHVHIHALMFLKGGTRIQDAQRLGDSMFGRWLPALTRRGFTAPSLRHGVDVRMITGGDASKLGDYFNKAVYAGAVDKDKAGWEIAGGTHKMGRKENRTPFQILEDVVANGDEADLALWHEWERGSRGRRQLTWSIGLRDFLGLNEERTDEEIAEDELGGEVELEITNAEWHWLKNCSEKLLFLVKADATLRLARQFLGRPPG